MLLWLSAARAHPTTVARPHLPSAEVNMEAFDIENFISEVEARPAIWDSRTGVYLDRDKRTQAWNELCVKFVPNFSEKNTQEKNSAATHIQRRWKSLRDCFKREYTKQMKELKQTNSVSAVRKPYKYYQNLSFLINVTETKGEVNSPVVLEEKESSDFSPRRKRKRKNIFPIGDITESEQELLQNFSEQFAPSASEVEEADRNFALSLLPHLKQVPYEYKLDAQMEMLMVLKKYKPFGRQTHYELYPDRNSRSQGMCSQVKMSPVSTEDGQALSDDSSINENLYY